MRDRIRIFLHLAKAGDPISDYSHRIEAKIKPGSYLHSPSEASGKLNIPVDSFYGYGKLAAFADCDPNFLLARRFGWLRNYTLLSLQDELAELEQKLEFHLRKIQKEDPLSNQSRRFRDHNFKETQGLLDNIRQTLDKYGTNRL